MKIKIALGVFLLGLCGGDLQAQSKHWQKNERELHYTENNGDFLLVKGKYRFNRALYGNNKASRVEAGDLPEFALYMPGMAGNLQFVLSANGKYKKLIEAERIETRYRPGAMVYRVKDTLIGTGFIDITVLAQYEEEGMIVKVQGENIPADAQFFAVFGGASGRTFSRGGDIGADPESGFYLLPEYCTDNTYKIAGNNFELTYLNRRKAEEYLYGTFSGTKKISRTDAHALQNLSQLTQNKVGSSPILYALYALKGEPVYIQLTKGRLGKKKFSDKELAKTFDHAEQSRLQLANRIKLHTPDRFINNFGSTLAVAADGIWESPTFLHGAVAWRMRLNAWRGAYTADALGWHDRAKEHFTSYSNSQVLEPASAKVVMDTALNLARHIEKMGTSMFSSGYISRNPNNNTVAHHYDMNLVFFDQLFTHFDYTGDTRYVEQLWPAIERHLDWERRNFKRGGLYDAYCAIWASDGLQYSGGGVAHTTAYNYRANRAAAKLAGILGKDATIYEKEADEILKAMKERLWLKEHGYFAEFQDKFGKQLVHDKPGLWTIYHVADAYMLDDFDNYQNVQYINNHLPHIPISVKGQEHEGLYTLATSTWQPYTWSVNNVALAENLQGALAYWQSGRPDEAYQLWKSNIIESMYHGISPGNFQQLSHYDAFRSELYRDFADPIGVASRTLTEGLFGVFPKLLDNQIIIKPGFPQSWDFAEIALPEWSYKFNRSANNIRFDIQTKYTKPVVLKFELPVQSTRISAVKVNGNPVHWTIKETSINQPVLEFETPSSNHFTVEVETSGTKIFTYQNVEEQVYTDNWTFTLPSGVSLLDLYDPQKFISVRSGNTFTFHPKERKGTFFVKLKQDDMIWWQAINKTLVSPVRYQFVQGQTVVQLENISSSPKSIVLSRNALTLTRAIPANGKIALEFPSSYLTKGANKFILSIDGEAQEIYYTNWDLKRGYLYDALKLGDHYNERVNRIFEQKYLSPRPEVPTLQLPTQGIGNWCYPLTTTEIDDSGLMAKRKNGLVDYMDIPFLIQGDQKNVLFVSQWDNYPTSATVPLSGQAQKLYLIMAGSTNPMQSQLVNAKVIVHYDGGGQDVLELSNPNNWWPIEQDLLDDNYAFEIADDQIPYRIRLKTGELYKGGTRDRYTEIKGYTNRAVDGGAATILDIPLDYSKTLKSLEIVAEANDVVVGLMAATLLR